jgi:ECF transporter S component (folate family)
MKTRKATTGMIARIALLVALDVILTRVLTVVNSQYLKIGIGFLPVALCGMLYGPLWGAVCGALGDAIGAVLFPAGDFFIGFTITAALGGMFFGVFLYGRKADWKNILAVAAANCVGLSLCANTVMIAYWFDVSILALLPSRAVQAAATIAAYFVFIPLLSKALIPQLRKAKLV